MKKRFLSLLLAGTLLLSPAFAADMADIQAEVQQAQRMELIPASLTANPEAAVTRADFCKLALAVLEKWEKDGLIDMGALPVPNASASFTDCSDPAVLKLARLGLITGTEPSRFSPQEPVSRQLAAVVLHRAAGLLPPKETGGWDETRLPHIFADGADIRAWARSSIYWVYRTGIMSADESNRFTPDSPCTNQQAIACVLRLYQYGAQPGQLPPAKAETYTLPNGQTFDSRTWTIKAAPFTGKYYIHEIESGMNNRFQLYDAQGKQLLTNLGDHGTFDFRPEISGDYVHIAQYDTIFHLPTGRQYKNYRLGPAANGHQYLWRLGPTNHCLRVDDDGATQSYDWSYICMDGEDIMLVRTGDGFARVDLASSQAQPLALPQGATPVRADGAGRIVGETESGQGMIVNGRLDANGYTFSNIAFCRYNPGYIGAKSGWYALYDAQGKKVAGPFENVLAEVGPDIYAYLVSNDVGSVLCTSGGQPRALFRKIPCAGTLPMFGQLSYDGGGVYSLAIDAHNIVFFDRFGDQISSLSVLPTLARLTDYSFVNGILHIDNLRADGAPAPAQWLLPTGESIPVLRSESP